MARFLIPMVFVVLAGIVGFATGLATPLLEILAGMVAADVFGVHGSEVVHFLGEMGIISLMYLAGLEVNVQIIKKEFKSSVLIGVATFIAPFAAIFLLAYAILGFSVTVSLICAIALSTTSVAIIYPILLSTGPLTHTEKSLLSAAMITDVLSIAALSLFFSDFSYWTAVVLVGLLAFVGPMRKLGHWFFSKVAAKEHSSHLKLKIVLLILLGLQFSAVLAGVEEVLLAFLFGVATSELIERFERIEEQLKAITFAFMTPFFFFNIGLGIPFADLLASLLLLLLFTAVTYTVKYVGTYVTTKHFFPSHASFSGHLFNSALSVGLITATLGLEEGIITQHIYIALVGAVILCSFLSTLLTRKQFTLEG